MEKEKSQKFLINSNYAYGNFVRLPMEISRPGLSEKTISNISKKNQEPGWLLEKRLQSFRYWLTLEEPQWANFSYMPFDYQKIRYYAQPKKTDGKVDPKWLNAFEKWGVPIKNSSRIAVDAIVDSVSVATTFTKTLKEKGIIFCSFREAVQSHPALIREYMGKVVSMRDNFFAALNMAVFTDGSFCYIPKGIRCPVELSTYFRINAAGTGQFERTLIIAEEKSYVSYLEGCTAVARSEAQLHAAVVEIYLKDEAEVRYATIQNWYPKGIHSFVTKRGLCVGKKSKLSWTQLEIGAEKVWKYPSCILAGEQSEGSFFSITLTRKGQETDSGTKMIHLGNQTKSHIVSKSISVNGGKNTYRGIVKIPSGVRKSKNFSKCDSLLMEKDSAVYTLPFIQNNGQESKIEHEATISKIESDQLFFCRQRGLKEDESITLIVHGYCNDVLKKLPMEFAREAKQLLTISFADSVG